MDTVRKLFEYCRLLSELKKRRDCVIACPDVCLYYENMRIVIFAEPFEGAFHRVLRYCYAALCWVVADVHEERRALALYYGICVVIKRKSVVVV